MGPSPKNFGHPGAGGSVGFADPEKRIGFGYVMNQMKATLLVGGTGEKLVNAVYESLE
jgi:CubicO group peptidase (beta-lactamase class C family)